MSYIEKWSLSGCQNKETDPPWILFCISVHVVFQHLLLLSQIYCISVCVYRFLPVSALMGLYASSKNTIFAATQHTVYCRINILSDSRWKVGGNLSENGFNVNVSEMGWQGVGSAVSFWLRRKDWQPLQTSRRFQTDRMFSVHQTRWQRTAALPKWEPFHLWLCTELYANKKAYCV